MKRIIYVLVMVLLASGCMAEQKFQEKVWPNYIECKICQAWQVGHILLHFEPTLVKKSEVLHLSSANLRLVFVVPYQQTVTDLTVLAMTKQYTDKDGVRRFYKDLGVTTTHDFFHKLGLPANGKTHKNMQDVYDITKAMRYISYRGKEASAFYVDVKDKGMDALYIVPADVDKFVYLLKGDFNEHTVEDILAHTRPARD